MPNDNNNNEERMNKVEQVMEDLCEMGTSLEDGVLIEWVINGVVISPDLLSQHIWCHRQATKKRTISRPDILTVLFNMKANMDTELTRAFMEKIKYSPDAPDVFEELSKMISRNNYDPHYHTVWRHVIWTIKRRLIRKDDYCPLFVSLYGGAGTGKSECLSAMFSLMPSSKMDIQKFSKNFFEDERQQFRTVERYVCIMDEISGMSKTDVNHIKNQIDSKKVIYRVLGHNYVQEGRNNAQLIGTSNTRLCNTIHVDTDIRKWAEVDIQSDLVDREVKDKFVEPLRAFDWLSMWKCVNEEGPCEFESNPEVYEDFKKWTSNKCRHESATSLFVDDILDRYGGQWVSKTELYDKMYRNSVMDFPKNWSNLKEDFEKRGCKSVKRNTGIGLLITDKTMEFTNENITN